ncbi:hypothetical protein [Mesorhizobium sp. M1143]|uniref:hypothetical protein n=1 Tax=Mesorhizobium sp. M1143 TaxID=2957061 RepID=UPI003335DE78
MRKKLLISKHQEPDGERQHQVQIPRKPAYRLAEFLHIYPGSRSKLFEVIAAGRLIARKEGASTIILHDEYEEYLRSLPKVDPKTVGPEGGE